MWFLRVQLAHRGRRSIEKGLLINEQQIRDTFAAVRRDNLKERFWISSSVHKCAKPWSLHWNLTLNINVQAFIQCTNCSTIAFRWGDSAIQFYQFSLRSLCRVLACVSGRWRNVNMEHLWSAVRRKSRQTEINLLFSTTNSTWTGLASNQVCEART